MSVFYLSTRTKKDNQHQEKEIHKNYQSNMKQRNAIK